jgi:transcriptional regulator with XRE-family HTH domain|tara:strand:- start:508 stop:723 length:216 start_codon:yes stop_codon:yes gene_type:complete
MRLKEWIRGNGFTYQTFADEIGASKRNVEKWARGERLPRWAEAEKLFVYTENQVTGQDLYDQQIQRKKASI